MYGRDEPILECQDCGRFLRTLSMSEEQDRSHRPYSWVVYCTTCAEDRRKALWLDG